MSVLIDPPNWPGHGRMWSHLASDSSLEELHEFAARLGIPRRGFEGDHYDVPDQWYDSVVAAGAAPVSSKELLARLTAAGLRLRKRKGDRGIAVVPRVVFPDQGVADIDLIAADRPATESRVFCASVFVRDAGGRFAVLFSRRRQEWGPPGGWREQGETPLQTAIREAREETGLVLDPGLLRPVAYERFRLRVVGELGELAGDLMQVYECVLAEDRPPLTSGDDGVEGGRWVDPTELARLCGGLFWWPLAEHLGYA